MSTDQERICYAVCLSSEMSPEEALINIPKLGITEVRPAGFIEGQAYVHVEVTPEQVEVLRQQTYVKDVWIEGPVIPASKK